MRRIKQILLISFFSFVVFSVSFSADETIRLAIKIDKNKINVGDRIKLTVQAKDSSGYEILFPQRLENIGKFSFVSSHPIKSHRIKSREKYQEYMLTIYDIGRYDTPPIRAQYRKQGENEWQSTMSPSVNVDVASLLSGQDKDIKGIKDLVEFGRGSLFAILLLVCAAVIMFVIWFLKYRKRKSDLKLDAHKKSPAEIAYERLGELKKLELLKKGYVKEYYVRLSEIIRAYMEMQFSFRAPEMTTEEFMNAIKDSPTLTAGHKRLLKDFLSHCDMVKFAKYDPTQLETLDSFKIAERFIDETKESL